MSKPKTKKSKRSWRDNPDQSIRSFPSWPNPPSLSPDDQTTFNAAAGSIADRAIVDSYAFRFPVRIVEGVLA